MSHITENVGRILATVPDGVLVVAAIKGRSADEVREVVDAGIHFLGANYVSDGRLARQAAGQRAECHFIGRLRPHDVRPGTLSLFDMVQSVASHDIAARIDARSAVLGRITPVLIEVNSGREPQKDGVLPEDVPAFIDAVSGMEHLAVRGLMTMGPLSDNPGDYRPCFAETRRLFESLRTISHPRLTMRYLSMGMSASYRVAIDEGANMVRLGTILFEKQSSRQ